MMVWLEEYKIVMIRSFWRKFFSTKERKSSGIRISKRWIRVEVDRPNAFSKSSKNETLLSNLPIKKCKLSWEIKLCWQKGCLILKSTTSQGCRNLLTKFRLNNGVIYWNFIFHNYLKKNGWFLYRNSDLWKW